MDPRAQLARTELSPAVTPPGHAPTEPPSITPASLGDTSGDPAMEDLPRRVHGMMRQGAVATVGVVVVDLVYARWVFPATDLRVVIAVRVVSLAMYLALVFLPRATTHRGAWGTLGVGSSFEL